MSSVENKNTNRTSISLVISTLLHGSVIALIAVGPAFLPNLKLNRGDSDLKQTQISFETLDSTSQPPQTLADIQTVAVPEQVNTTVQPEVTMQPVDNTTAPTTTVVAKAPATLTPATTTKTIPTPLGVKTYKTRAIADKPATALPNKKIVKIDFEPSRPTESDSDIEPQPLVAVADTQQEAVELPEHADAMASTTVEKENLIESQQPAAAEPENVTAKETPAPIEALATKEDVQPTVTTADLAPVSSATTTDVTPVDQEKPLAAPVISAANQPATTPSATQASAPAEAAALTQATGAPAPIGNSNAANAEPIKVTQSYTGLKQVPGNKPPSYTRDMRLNRAQGQGQLVYFVNKDGLVSDLKLTRSTGQPTLDKAAITAFSKYKFVPGQEGYTVHDFEFRLKGPEAIEDGRLKTSMNK